GTALVDDPFAIRANPRPADGVVLVEGDLDRLAVGGQTLADDIGRRAEDLADVIKGLAVAAPHRRVILALEAGDALVVAAVGVTHPDVVVGRAAIAFAIPGARPAD